MVAGATTNRCTQCGPDARQPVVLRVEAAQRLRSSDKTLREKIKHYGLDCPDDEL
jgi:hypothetical protein